MIPGIFIGFLIGILSGTVTLVLLRAVSHTSIVKTKSVIAITFEFLAIPTFWFGGPWITTRLLETVNLQEILNPYIVSLAIVYLIMIIYPIFRWIVKVGDELG